LRKKKGVWKGGVRRQGAWDRIRAIALDPGETGSGSSEKGYLWQGRGRRKWTKGRRTWVSKKGGWVAIINSWKTLHADGGSSNGPRFGQDEKEIMRGIGGGG